MIEKLYECCANGLTVRDITIKNCDINDKSLIGLYADGIILSEIRIEKSCLDNAHWRNCRLNEVRLIEVKIRNATLRMCTWVNVRSDDCDFSAMKFENSNAQGCVFTNVNFSHASLCDSNFSRASLRGANLEYADATGINLRGADLTGANCSRVDFSDADLRGADFTTADLTDAILKYADTRGAIFDPGVLEDEATTQSKALFTPETQKLADAVSPVVAEIIKMGTTAGVLSEKKQRELLRELDTVVTHPAESSASQQELDKILKAVLKRAGETGIASIILDLKNGGDEPSAAIADMLKNMAKDLDLDLDENATTEDLVEKLIKVI